MTRLGALMIATTLAGAGVASAAENVPYVVRGNTHMLIGVTLDADAVRSMLPEGLEPAEGVSGGLQVYSSDGGEGVAAYSRTYVWVDLANFDSITGAAGRYMLWLGDTEHAEKMGAIGYQTAAVDIDFGEADGVLTGSAAVGGTTVLEGVVKGGDCGAGTGVINYPSMPTWGGGMAVTQYAFAGDFCAGELVEMTISAPADHALAKLNIQPAGWAAVARNLSFSATPAMPLPASD